MRAAPVVLFPAMPIRRRHVRFVRWPNLAAFAENVPGWGGQSLVLSGQCFLPVLSTVFSAPAIAGT